MSAHTITVGLRTIGSVCKAGHQWEAWSEPGREPLGRFDTYQAACRDVYQRDLEERAMEGQK